MPRSHATQILGLERYEIRNIDEESDDAVVLFVAPTSKELQCRLCRQRVSRVHCTQERTVRHLNAFHRRAYLRFHVRYFVCDKCGVNAEETHFVEPRKRTSKAFRRYVGELCKLLPNSQVAQHLGISEDAVRAMDKEYLAAHYPLPDLSKLRRIAVDEIAYRKGHRYITVVLDHESGEIVWTGEGKGAETFGAFFEHLGSEGCSRIQAVSMDMAAAYSKAVREHCLNARHVFDRFHVAKHLNKAVNETRMASLRKATKEQRKVIWGKRFILLRRGDSLDEKQSGVLDELLKINEPLTRAYLMKEDFDRFWNIGNAGAAARFLDRWVAEALREGSPAMARVAKMLRRHRDGLLAYHTHPMTNGPLEGLNTKINVLKRSRYGFRDLKYFGLKIRQLSIERSPRQLRRPLPYLRQNNEEVHAL